MHATSVGAVVWAVLATFDVAGAQEPKPACLSAFHEQSMLISQIDETRTLRAADGTSFKLAGLHLPSFSKTHLGQANSQKFHSIQDELAKLIEGKTANLIIADKTKTRYGASNAHVFIPSTQDGSWVWVQAELVSRGLARVFPNANKNPCMALLLALEAKARKASKGLWKFSTYRILQSNDLKQLRRAKGHLHLIEGRIHNVAVRRSRSYINFSQDWRRDFTVTVSRSVYKKFSKIGIDIETLKGRRVRVRGWLDRRNGPTLIAHHVAQIEILDE